jgi:pimeloyl-ACP methyl ester carboxylesterase
MATTELTVSAYEGFASECRTRRHPGPGPAPVLLIGGALQRKEGWGRLETALARHTTVISVDLPGWGSADVLPAHYGMDFLADALAALLDAAGHGPVHVFGGSYGSAIGYRFGQRHPGRVLGLALFGAMARVPEFARPALVRTLKLLREEPRDEFAAEVLRIMLCQDPAATIARRDVVRRILAGIFGSIDEDDADKYEQNTLRLLRPDLMDRGPAPQVPMLFGVGEHDTFTTPRLCRELAENCPGSYFAVLRDADHPVHLERPDELADLLLRFFSSGDPGSPAYCASLERIGAVSLGAPPASDRPARDHAFLAEDPVPVQEEVGHRARQARHRLRGQVRHAHMAQTQHERQRDHVVEGHQHRVLDHLLADVSGTAEGEVPVQRVVHGQTDDETGGGGQGERHALAVQRPQRPGVHDVAGDAEGGETAELLALDDPQR